MKRVLNIPILAALVVLPPGCGLAAAEDGPAPGADGSAQQRSGGDEPTGLAIALATEGELERLLSEMDLQDIVVINGRSHHVGSGDVAVPARWGQYQEHVFAQETAAGLDLAGGGPGRNQIRTFSKLAANNAAAVVLAFLKEGKGC